MSVCKKLHAFPLTTFAHLFVAVVSCHGVLAVMRSNISLMLWRGRRPFLLVQEADDLMGGNSEEQGAQVC